MSADSEPPPTDSLGSRVDARRREAMAALDVDAQRTLGQFFTSKSAADLVAMMPQLLDRGTMRVLDPGAGVGSLTAALVERAIREAPSLSLELVAVELDVCVVPQLQETLTDCVKEGARHGMTIDTQLLQMDFLLDGVEALFGDTPLSNGFDFVIMNPPYAKLPANSRERKAMSKLGWECPNTYAAFMAMGMELLKPGGQMTAIVPRSFANGSYFERFRQRLVGASAIRRVHTFESRSAVFAEMGVLQENVIITTERDGRRGVVDLTFSRSHDDKALNRSVPHTAVVDPKDPKVLIRIPNKDCTLPASAQQTINDLGVAVSTGKVVEFRCSEFIVDEPNDGTVPFIYPANVRGGIIEWPRDCGKPQAFKSDTDTASKHLLPPGCYVVIKRFSAKEERRRVVAAVWEGDTGVAFENHLNIVHDRGHGIDLDLAIGISYWLNSTVLDRNFREFSGHTQVNAGDLRMLPFPPTFNLRSLGRAVPARLPNQSMIDYLVAEALLKNETCESNSGG